MTISIICYAMALASTRIDAVLDAAIEASYWDFQPSAKERNSCKLVGLFLISLSERNTMDAIVRAMTRNHIDSLDDDRLAIKEDRLRKLFRLSEIHRLTSNTIKESAIKYLDKRYDKIHIKDVILRYLTAVFPASAKQILYIYVNSNDDSLASLAFELIASVGDINDILAIDIWIASVGSTATPFILHCAKKCKRMLSAKHIK